MGAKPTDDVLLVHAMMLISSVDGEVAGAELATLDAFVNTLPELKDADLDAQLAAARAVRSRHASDLAAVAALADIASDAVRKKAFVIATDIAMANGDIDARERALLDAMQRVLRIDDALAARIVEVLAIKYAR